MTPPWTNPLEMVRRPTKIVDREALTRSDQRSLCDVGDTMNILHAALTALVECGEGTNGLDHAQRLDRRRALICGRCSEWDFDRSMALTERQRPERANDRGVATDAPGVVDRHEDWTVVDDIVRDGQLVRRIAEKQLLDVAIHLDLIERDLELAIHRFHGNPAGEVRWREEYARPAGEEEGARLGPSLEPGEQGNCVPGGTAVGICRQYPCIASPASGSGEPRAAIAANVLSTSRALPAWPVCRTNRWPSKPIEGSLGDRSSTLGSPSSAILAAFSSNANHVDTWAGDRTRPSQARRPPQKSDSLPTACAAAAASVSIVNPKAWALLSIRSSSRSITKGCWA